jgi:MFS family permease
MSGQMLGPAIGGVLAALTDWRVAIALAAAIGAAVAVVCGALWRRAGRPVQVGAHADAARRAAMGPQEGPPPARLELLALASVPFATFFGIAGLTQTLIPLVGAGELGLSTSTIGFAIGGATAARFVSAWYAGVGSDRWSRKVVLVPMLVVMLAGALLLALPLGNGTWLASIVALAIGSAGISVAAAALADRVDADRLGHELGLFRLLGDLGLLVGPAVSAFLYQEVDARAAAFATAAVFGLALVSTMLWVRGSRGPQALPPHLDA